MNVLKPILSSVLSFLLLASPVAAQFTPSLFATSTPPVTSATSTATSPFSNYTTTDSSGSGSSLTTGLVLGGLLLGGLVLSNFLTTGVSAVANANPSVVAKTGLSFGGRITVAIPCLSDLGPSYWVTIVPAPATKQPFYIWTPETLRGLPPPGLPPLFPPSPNPDVPPPTHPGQEILGLADIPFWCCLPGGFPAEPGTCVVPHPPWEIPGLDGERMQWASQSPI